MRLRMMKPNWYAVKSPGARYLNYRKEKMSKMTFLMGKWGTYLLRSLSGNFDLAAFSQIMGTLSGYLSMIFLDSSWRCSKIVKNKLLDAILFVLGEIVTRWETYRIEAPFLCMSAFIQNILLIITN